MEKKHISGWIRLAAGPAVMMVLGLILLGNPDSAAALISRILGWVLVACGVLTGVAAVFSADSRKLGIGIRAVAWVLVGGVFLKQPMMLAESLGLVLGIMLAARGAWNLLEVIKENGLRLSAGLVLAAAVLLVGLVLIFSPMTTSRVLFTVIGILLIAIGAAQLLDRIRGSRHLHSGDSDPDIIDVEKL